MGLLRPGMSRNKDSLPHPAGQMFEAPAGLDKFTDRLKDVMSWWIEAG